VAVWISLGFVTFAGCASCIKCQVVRMYSFQEMLFVLQFQTALKSCSMSIMLIFSFSSLLVRMLLMVLCKLIVKLLFAVCDEKFFLYSTLFVEFIDSTG